jgi:hypothetical protein
LTVSQTGPRSKVEWPTVRALEFVHGGALAFGEPKAQEPIMDDQLKTRLAQLLELIYGQQNARDQGDDEQAAPDEQSMTIEEFAERYKIGRTTAFAEVKAGRLKTFKVGRLRRTTPTLAREWLAARIAETEGEAA